MSIDDKLKKSAIDTIKEYGFEDEAARIEFAKLGIAELSPQETDALRKRFRDDPEDEILQRIFKRLDS